MLLQDRSALIKQTAARLGFDRCGIALARPLDEDARRLEAWLAKGFHGQMSYLERNFDLRTDPAKLVPGAKSVITLLFNYFPSETQSEDAPKIARYAYGEDYHDVIRTRLNNFLNELRAQFGAIEGRGFIDSAPVLERSWANVSGLGWIGKNGNLLNRSMGSYFFIATLITDLDLTPDDAFAADHCGSCRRCLDACPTGALVSPSVLDARKCISYATIELRDALLPDAVSGHMEGWAFGCDICQEVCPWNRFSAPRTDDALQPLREVLQFSVRDWEALTEEGFRKAFRRSAISRTKYAGMMRNIRAVNPENKKAPPEAEL